MNEQFVLDRWERMLFRLPVCFDWVEFKGETVVASINYQATKRVGRPMMDLHYCMTRALNGYVLKTVQWDKSKFAPSRLGFQWK